MGELLGRFVSEHMVILSAIGILLCVIAPVLLAGRRDDRGRRKGNHLKK